jgi:hypothetical protein
MKTTAQCVQDLARHFDENGKTDQPIVVHASRDYMRRFFKPAKRGGVLLCGAHEVRCRGFIDPAPEQVDIEQVTS